MADTLPRTAGRDRYLSHATPFDNRLKKLLSELKPYEDWTIQIHDVSRDSWDAREEHATLLIESPPVKNSVPRTVVKLGEFIDRAMFVEVNSDMPDGEIYMRILATIMTMEEHEVFENFGLRSEPTSLIDPHVVCPRMKFAFAQRLAANTDLMLGCLESDGQLHSHRHHSSSPLEINTVSDLLEALLRGGIQ